MRGFMFTITTLLLLSSLSVFSSFYLTMSQENQNSIPVTSVAGRMGYLENDIANDYFDLLGVGFKKIERGSSMEIDFGEVYTLYSGKTYTQTLNDYEDFVENTYAGLTNSEIELELSQNFTVAPYNISFQSNGEFFYLYTDSPDEIQSIEIEVRTDKFNATGSGFPATENSDYPTITVIIKDVNETTILSQIQQLNPNNVHDPFYVIFSDGSEVNVRFGNYEKAGTMIVEASDLIANISMLEMDYGLTDENVFIRADGSYSVDMSVGDMSKTGYLVLFKE
jgi:hypothetical protein